MLIVDFKPGTRSLGSLAEAGADVWAPGVGVVLALAPDRFGSGRVWGSRAETSGARCPREWLVDSYFNFQRRVGSDQGDGRARY